MSNVPPTLAERLGILLRCLTQAAVNRAYWGHLSLPGPLVGRIVDRLRVIKVHLERIATLVAAGEFVPRRPSGAPRAPAAPRPWRPGPLPREYGWLLKLVPEAAGSHSGLRTMLADPELLALIEAAPGSVVRPLRSLCFMLRLPPPPILARRREPRPPRPGAPAAASAPAPQPAPAASPERPPPQAAPPQPPPPDRATAPPRPA